MSVSGRARYTYSKTQPLGLASANREVRRPFSSMATNSPGSISRTKLAPQMSRAADAEATPQARSSRPRSSGRGARAPAEAQRADALRVAGGVEGGLVHEDEAEGAAHLREDRVGGLLDGQRL